MTKAEAKKRIEKLKKVINHHRYLYHVLDREEISDAALDLLKNELKKLEEEFPELITKDSPTQRVGGEPLEKFEKVEHSSPMLSIDDVFSKKEVGEWESHIKRLVLDDKFEYFCELKIDGFAISLIYNDGVLIRAATRGNGKIGEDVTQNIKTIKSIPLSLSIGEGAISANVKRELKKIFRNGIFEMRGEVYMDKKTFDEVNREQKKKGEKEYANPRNLAAGSVRQLDPKFTASRNLKFLAYDIVGDAGQTNHSEEHEIARMLGFKTDDLAKICQNTGEVIDFWTDASSKRDSLPFHIDGVVVSVNDNRLFSRLGVAGKSPRGIRALKFAPKQTISIIEDIKVHIGRTGALTPIAHLTPVNIGGVKVRRATLHNQDEIKRLGVKIGDTVIVERAGDVIPDVVGVIEGLRTGKEKNFTMPAKCPVCANDLARPEGEVVLRCPNKNCAARSREYLHYFVSKKAFDIDGLGPKIIDQLAENNLISEPPDLFDIAEEDLMTLERFEKKSASNTVRAIEDSKSITLARFINALGIRHVGEETAEHLAQYFGSIENLEKASLEDLEKIPDVGNVVASEIREWFSDKNNSSFVKSLLKKGVRIKKPERIGTKLKGLTFVFTGSLKILTRQEAEKKVRMFGGDASGSVSAKTDYVVAGENPGSKYDKAKLLGVKVISEKQFIDMAN